MVKHCKFLCLLLAMWSTSSAFGQGKMDAALEAWIKSSGKSVLKNRVLVTGSIEKESFPRIQPLKKNEYYRMLGFLQPSVANTSAFFLVNNIKPKTSDAAGKILRMDFVLEIQNENIVITHLASNKSITVASGPNEDEFIGRLRRGFGYDGYVVDTKQDLILARVTGNLLQKGSQAIIVNSDDPFLAAQSKIGAASLIEMIARRGDFGLFRVIIGKSGSELPKGSRVQFSTN